METVILKALSIGYLSKNHQKQVAGPLSEAIKGGELTCLLGRNGIGKSTLLRTLSAFQPALGGEVWMIVDGQLVPMNTLSDQQMSTNIGVVLTEKPDVQHMTVREMVGMGRSPYTGFWGKLSPADEDIVTDAIAMVGIRPLADRMVHTLSDGERQKVMIAKALAQQTPIIYLDEPTAFLDFPSKVETMQLLRRLAHEEQKTIFLSTHDVELSIQLADRIWLMEPEKLSVGTPRQLAENGALARFVAYEGVTFDPQTMTIKVEKNNGNG